MNKRPYPITSIGWLFIAFGSISLVAGLLSLADATPVENLSEFKPGYLIELGIVWIARIVAVLCGIFMLKGFNWSRWLLVVWLGYHIILSFLHTPLELLMHSLLSATVIYFLFRPSASDYFRESMIRRPNSKVA